MVIYVIRKEVYEDLVKSYGIRDRTHLVRKPAQVTRNGKVINTFVYVNPNKNLNKKKIAKKDVKIHNNTMKIKKGLTNTDAIADYIIIKLNKLGYKTKQEYSRLSNSRYITIENYKDMTGRESKYNDNELKIRVSNHDLPLTYDGLNGYHDIDIISENKIRLGNDGNATFYETVLSDLAKQVGVKTPEYDNFIEKQNKEKEEKKLFYEELKKEKENEKTNSRAKALKELKKDNEDLYNNIIDLISKLEEYTIEYGVRKNKYTGKERKKINIKVNEMLKKYGYEPSNL